MFNSVYNGLNYIDPLLGFIGFIFTFITFIFSFQIRKRVALNLEKVDFKKDKEHIVGKVNGFIDVFKSEAADETQLLKSCQDIGDFIADITSKYETLTKYSKRIMQDCKRLRSLFNDPTNNKSEIRMQLIALRNHLEGVTKK